MQDLADKAEEHNVDLYFETSAYPEYKGTIEAMFNAVIKKLADLPLEQSRRNIRLGNPKS